MPELLDSQVSANNQRETDSALVAKTLQQPAAYQFIIQQYREPLGRYVRRLGCQNGDDIEDILQETFIKAYLNLNGYNPKLKLSSWLYRICHNETIDFFRRKKVRPQPAQNEDELLLIEQIQADIDIAGDIDQQLLKDRIGAALNQLDEKYRTVVVLKYLEERSYEEIADILKKPPGTVATLLNRAKQQLKGKLSAN